MSEPIKVSIIAPIYNSDKSTRQLSLNSLLNQTLRQVEFIFVNDCCIDDTMDLIKEFALKDDRIKIIDNPQNLSVGPSRNNGIDNAQGEYIAHFDIDDFIQHDFLEKLYNKTLEKKYDIVKGSRITVKSKQKEFSNFNNEVRLKLQRNELFPFFYEHTTAIYKRDFLKKNNIYYGTSSRGSDTTYLFRVCSYSPSIAFVDEVNYFYMINSSSLTQTKSISFYQGYLKMIKEIILHYEKIKNPSNEQEYRIILQRFIKHEINKIVESPNANAAEMQNIIAEYIVLLKKYAINS